MGNRGNTRREALTMAAAAAAVGASAANAQVQFPQGAVIRTVLRDYRPEEIAGGATLFHEHMSLPPAFMPKWSAEAAAQRRRNIVGNPPPAPAGRGGAAAAPAQPAAAAPAAPRPHFMQDVPLMTEEMRAAKADGIACIVDGGHPAMGRDMAFLKQISQGSGLPIVSGAGFYSQPFYPPELSGWSEDQVFRALMRQVETEPVGVFGEIGSWDFMTRDERKVFRAVGRASLATNMSIFTHTGIPGKAALEQLDILEDVGVDPKKICIGHLGNLNDPAVEVHGAICRRGAFVGFDRQGGNGDAPVVPMVMKLIEGGFEDHILLASDFSSEAQLKKNNPSMGYAKTLTVFVPKLKAAGASDAVLKKIMNDNPRRFLAYVPKLPRRG